MNVSPRSGGGKTLADVKRDAFTLPGVNQRFPIVECTGAKLNVKGLELAKAYWRAYGEEMLNRDFPALAGKVAVGLCGSGSECLGYDDACSADHDFEPGFCVFLPGEEVISRQEAFQLERAYAKLPKEFMGYSREKQSPVGGSRHGVIRLSDFLTEKTGTPDGHLSTARWLSVPEQNLLEAVNGEIWRDDSDLFTSLRWELAFLPEDIRLRKLSGELLLMNQSGQYNYRRCLNHGESGAAMLAAGEFVRAAIHVLLLMDGKYMPYYKWAFRALRSGGEKRAAQAARLEEVLRGGTGEEEALDREIGMADLCQEVAEELQDRGWTEASCCDLEQHAYSVADHIADGDIRNMHILAGV